MKKKEIMDLGAEELRRKESEVRDEIFRLKMKRTASALDNKMLIRTRKRDLARIMTVLRMRAAEGAKER
jgi:large subunit ribosomal protein L29